VFESLHNSGPGCKTKAIVHKSNDLVARSEISLTQARKFQTRGSRRSTADTLSKIDATQGETPRR
jgi:hypothetical protein